MNIGIRFASPTALSIPMRFFNYNLSAMDLDNSYIPKQTPLNFNEKGESIFVFALKTRTSMKMKEKTPKNSEK